MTHDPVTILDQLEATLASADQWGMGYDDWDVDDLRALLAVARAAVNSHDHRQALVGGTCETCAALAPLLRPAEERP